MASAVDSSLSTLVSAGGSGGLALQVAGMAMGQERLEGAEMLKLMQAAVPNPPGVGTLLDTYA